MLLTLTIVALVLAALAVVLHLLPKQADPTIAKAQHDVDAVYDWIVTHLEHHAQPTSTIPTLSVGGSSNPPDIPINPAIPVTPAECVRLCLAASAGFGGYRNGLSWNNLLYLRGLAVKDLAAWLAAVGAQPECVAAPGTQGDSLGWIVRLNDAGQGILAAVVQALGTTILNTTVDPRTA